MLARNRNFCRQVCLAFLVTAVFGADDESTFQSVLENPKAYQNEQVSLTGVIAGNGPVFELYKSASDAERPAPASESLYVISGAGKPQTGLYNLYKVRITGIVDANRHGHWGNPCTIVLGAIEVLSAEPVAMSKFPTAVFRNDSPESVVVRLRNGNPEVTFPIPARSAVQSIISDGEDIDVLSHKGSLILHDKIQNLDRSSPYYERKTGNFYYLIRDNKVKRVLPDLAKNWKWLRG